MKDQQDQTARVKEWQHRLMYFTSGLLIFETLTGLSIYILPFSISNQVMVLLHSACLSLNNDKPYQTHWLFFYGFNHSRLYFRFGVNVSGCFSNKNWAYVGFDSYCVDVFFNCLRPASYHRHCGSRFQATKKRKFRAGCSRPKKVRVESACDRWGTICYSCSFRICL